MEIVDLFKALEPRCDFFFMQMQCNNAALYARGKLDLGRYSVDFCTKNYQKKIML